MALVQHRTASGTDLHEDKRVKEPVRAASIANVNIASPGATLDGVTLTAGDRVLLKDQTTTTQNGIYVWTASASPLSRAADAAAASDFVYGFLTFVREGTVNARALWLFTQTLAVTLGVTPLTFSQLNPSSFTGEVTATDYKASGLTGATAASRYVGGTTSGPPTSGTFAVGDFAIDQTGREWICIAAGTPGTWKSSAGAGSALLLASTCI